MEFSQVKQSLQSIFGDIQDQVQQGQLPSEETVSSFLRLATRMHSLAEEEWADECEDFHHLVKELLRVVKKGSIEEAVLLVEALDDAQAYCHQSFRF